MLQEAKELKSSFRPKQVKSLLIHKIVWTLHSNKNEVLLQEIGSIFLHPPKKHPQLLRGQDKIVIVGVLSADHSPHIAESMDLNKWYYSQSMSKLTGKEKTSFVVTIPMCQLTLMLVCLVDAWSWSRGFEIGKQTRLKGDWTIPTYFLGFSEGPSLLSNNLAHNICSVMETLPGGT